MKKTFEAALKMAGHTLKYGKRKLSPVDYIKAVKAYNETYKWFQFFGYKLSDEKIQEYIAKHSDTLLLIIPGSKSGNTILEKLNLKP